MTSPTTIDAQIKVSSALDPTINGISATFNILTPPTTPILVWPTNGLYNVTVTPALDWNDSTGLDITYRVLVATASTFAAATLVENQTVTASTWTVPADDLDGYTTYWWKVNASNGVGTSAWSVIRNFRTGIGPLPTAPDDLNAATVSATRIDLAWNVDGYGIKNTHTLGYKIERSKGDTSNWAQIATVGANILVYSNTGLTANTKYYYRVRAYNASGNSDFGDVDNATTLPLVPTLISPAAGATNVPTSGQLTWSDASGASSYDVQISTDIQFNNKVLEVPGSDTFLSFAGWHSNLKSNTTYYWRVNASNAGGTSAWSVTRNFKTASNWY